ncbi:DUF4148 domain-containing protein [Paraburkholderia domus]|uniref:DUF4148 domain-containing protein n=1 Tax=Paraburkholderia domus TaxID=2793075 RepID=A0A9N8N8V7_9BURK|nr:DUF4148 domain-containing protein [Paraburkholderia domus]MBK5053750.1 DUF4148 domain-containing protein [Burkholderia sp. R-70006]MBK5065600.1 DUF4148 domain-containing protein [Burkholderia sp. R-70199]MBK5169785.1 DUF4148 domain-containing protein [Burkholderia sp. R-70211]MBK5185240.1 DUF4148 domain-containing protein [Burkholderia sp. R-69749]CAE6843976.1 hypothetical protein R70006_07244 [Paraburkholderia domus]
MKSLIQAVVIGAALSAPMVSFAQSSAPLTRAQVKAEVVELEKSGYSPAAANDFNYPQIAQTGEERVAANSGNGVGGEAATGFGGAVEHSNISGSPAGKDSTRSPYLGY